MFGVDRPLWYRLDGEDITPEGHIDGEFSLWYANFANRRIAQEDVDAPDGRTWFVSTVFLAVDQSLTLEGPPVLFDTTIFRVRSHDELERRRAAAYAALTAPVTAGLSPEEAQSLQNARRSRFRLALDPRGEPVYQRRYTTRRAAEAGHAYAVRMVREGRLGELRDLEEQDDGDE